MRRSTSPRRTAALTATASSTACSTSWPRACATPKSLRWRAKPARIARDAGAAMAQLGEFGLIERFFDRPLRDRNVTLGIGDDAAIVQVTPGCELVLAVDMMVESRHFLPD